MSRTVTLQILQGAKKKFVNSLKGIPGYAIDNIIVEGLNEIKANDKIKSEIAVRLKDEIKNSERRYVTVNKELI